MAATSKATLRLHAHPLQHDKADKKETDNDDDWTETHDSNGLSMFLARELEGEKGAAVPAEILVLTAVPPGHPLAWPGWKEESTEIL